MGASKGKGLRAFVALDLDPTSLRRAVRLGDRLRGSSGAPSARWEPAARLHVTLKFAAALPQSAVAPLGEALGRLIQGEPAPAASAVRLEAFPSPTEALIVVAELLDPQSAIGALARRVADLTRAQGVPDDDRPYRPHVTLARLRMAYDARKWLRAELAEAAGELRAGALTLYESQPSADGSIYVPRARFVFAPPA